LVMDGESWWRVNSMAIWRYRFHIFWPIFQAYFCKGISPQNIALYGTVAPF
jgi:hypothetical protein